MIIQTYLLSVLLSNYWEKLYIIYAMSYIENYINNNKKWDQLKIFNNVSYKSTMDVVSSADVTCVKEPTVIKKKYWRTCFFSALFFFSLHLILIMPFKVDNEYSSTDNRFDYRYCSNQAGSYEKKR
jgi:hypothetical protein